MKKQVLLAGALLLSFTAFSQAQENNRNEHGSQVRTVAKSETEAQLHGDIVSAVASSKSQASADARAERLFTRSERRERKEARRASHESNRESASQRREEAKAGILTETGIEMGGADRAEKGSKGDKGIKARTGINTETGIKGNGRSKAGVKTSVGTDVQLSRPNIKIGSRLNVGAGIF